MPQLITCTLNKKYALHIVAWACHAGLMCVSSGLNVGVIQVQVCRSILA